MKGLKNGMVVNVGTVQRAVVRVSGKKGVIQKGDVVVTLTVKYVLRSTSSTIKKLFSFTPFNICEQN